MLTLKTTAHKDLFLCPTVFYSYLSDEDLTEPKIITDNNSALNVNIGSYQYHVKIFKIMDDESGLSKNRIETLTDVFLQSI